MNIEDYLAEIARLLLTLVIGAGLMLLLILWGTHPDAEPLRGPQGQMQAAR